VRRHAHDGFCPGAVCASAQAELQAGALSRLTMRWRLMLDAKRATKRRAGALKYAGGVLEACQMYSLFATGEGGRRRRACDARGTGELNAAHACCSRLCTPTSAPPAPALACLLQLQLQSLVGVVCRSLSNFSQLETTTHVKCSSYYLDHQRPYYLLFYPIPPFYPVPRRARSRVSSLAVFALAL
jgi:hypothetical protein